MRNDPEWFAQRSQEIHGGDLGACGCCGRPKPEHGNHEREHQHSGEGVARGVACYRCNHLLLRNHDLASARMMVAYLERVEAFYGRGETDDGAGA